MSGKQKLTREEENIVIRNSLIGALIILIIISLIISAFINLDYIFYWFIFWVSLGLGGVIGTIVIEIFRDINLPIINTFTDIKLIPNIIKGRFRPEDDFFCDNDADKEAARQVLENEFNIDYECLLNDYEHLLNDLESNEK